MGKTAKNIFDEKVSLIYEYNKKSPLFVRKANAEIFANNLDKAVEILQEGLPLYPDYPTAHIVLAKALTMLGKYDDALYSYKIGCGLINSETSYEFFSKEVALSKKQRLAFGKIPRQPLTFENDFHDEAKSLSDINTSGNQQEDTFEDRLGEIAEKISSIKRQPPPESIKKEKEVGNDSSSEIKLASETLAKIYVAQGEFKEAINMYHNLIMKDPSKQEYFLGKISELQAKYNLE